MEQNFQTSFIPKKPIIAERVVASRPIGLLMLISVFILLATLLVTGGLFIYKGIMTSSIVKMKANLELAKNRFEPSKITELRNLDRRLKAADEILSNHISITPIFEALQDITMKTVRYTKFNYVLGDNPESKILVKLSGQAIGYRSIALQSDLFAKNEHLIDPVFSNLTLNDHGEVMFNLDFLVDPSFIDYKNVLKARQDSLNTTLPAAPALPSYPSAPALPTTPNP